MTKLIIADFPSTLRLQQLKQTSQRTTLAIAYQWLCQQRKHYPANADVWSFRFHW